MSLDVYYKNRAIYCKNILDAGVSYDGSPLSNGDKHRLARLVQYYQAAAQQVLQDLKENA